MAKITIEFSQAKRRTDGTYLFETSDGTQREFANVQEVRAFATQDVETSELAWKFALGRLLYQEPNLTPNAQGNLAWLLGKAVDLEVEADTPVVVR